MPVLEPCGCQLVRGTNEFRRRCDLHSADKAEVERLRGLLREWYAPYADHWCQPDDLYGRTRAALAGTGDQPSAVPDFKTWREHELRYVCEAMRDISRQNGEAARESANDVLAWAENRLRAADNGTEGHMEKRNAD